VNSECLVSYQVLKLKKKLKYIIFKVSEDKTEIVLHKESASQDYDEFLADLPETECRWAVYDLEFQKEEGGVRNKIIFYHWCFFFLFSRHFSDNG
jgi:cofilin